MQHNEVFRNYNPESRLGTSPTANQCLAIVEYLTMNQVSAYEELLRRAREKSVLASCAELLAWDEVTYMPPAGAAHRATQMAILAGLIHERSADPRLGELLAAVETSNLVADPDSIPSANVRELRRLYDWDTRLPRTLVEETARVTALAETAWADARQNADFNRFRPWLDRVIRLSRESAAAVDPGTNSYDVLLRYYDPALTTLHLTDLFAELREALVPLAHACCNSSRRPNRSILAGPFPVERQRLFAEKAATAIGFDFTAGRLDTTTHPFFSSIGPGDTRITTRFRSEDFRDGLFAALHEVGHGLYEQNLPREHYGTPVGEAVSLTLHESQARLWENQVGRSLAFWDYYFPTARDLFPESLGGVDPRDAYFAINAIEPTYIRAAADEVTYNLHVLIRFELEQALIAGELPAADLPGAWAEKYRACLGIVPRNDAEGCLQDGHWAAAMFGYFPVYTVGSLIAAQLFAQARSDLPDVDVAFARGDFRDLFVWLRERIYEHGGRYPVDQLVERVTGIPLSIRPFLDGLRAKYGAMYGA
jgi:carboxypeptidase Taq